MEEKDNNTNELEELMLEKIDINEYPDESDDSRNLTDKSSAATRKKRKFPIWARILTAIFLIVVTVIIGWNILINVGKANLYAKSKDAAPQLPIEMMDSTADVADVGWEEGWVQYNGKIYRYNQDVLTFLVPGIDKDERVSDNTSGLDGGQSDGNFLVILNPDNESVRVICINRA